MKTNRYGKALAVFFALMIFLTMISRAADSFTVPRVTAEHVKRGTLIHQVICDGMIEAKEVISIRGVLDLRIQGIEAEAGMQTEVGDVLFSLDMEILKDKIEELKTDIEVLKLNLSKLQSTGTAKGEVESAKLVLQRAIDDDALETLWNDGKQLVRTKRAVEDAWEKLKSAEAALDREQRERDIDTRLKELELKEKQKEYEKVQVYMKNGGYILAEVQGTIGEIYVKQGEVMDGKDLCTIIPMGAGYEFKGKIDTKDSKYMKTGEAVEITVSGKNVPIKDSMLKAVSCDGETTKITASLSESTELINGMSASLRHKSTSEEYTSILPLGAVRGGEGAEFVLVIQEENRMLGSEKTAQKVDIEVLDKDNKNAAVRGNLEAKDSIITGSNKPISEGDRVREKMAGN